jgi:broad specificity phosphatase PhoE
MGSSNATLVFVRHGCANGVENGRSRLNGWTDCPLSKKGIEQAQRVALRLRNEGPFAAVYSSPLQRAMDTAQPIAASTQTPIVVCEGLREINCGELDGADVNDVERRFPSMWAANLDQTNPEFRWPGGESYREFRARCLATIASISKMHSGERAVVVTHAGVINQLVGHVLGTNAARWEPFRPRNATVTEMEWLEGAGRVLRFDDERHLVDDRNRSSPEGVGSTYDAQAVAGTPK